ncbi:DsbA family protein [Mastigocladopsis repens]|uniref:DsbA family protein n=1 Tax=Mastigocladopsis repens TaxID=221287 RepID=UPI00031BEF9D|nr:DsbA family protein [Mastigocladopsis repens]
MSLGDYNRLLVPISKQDHIQGRVSASVALVQYGDYQCPTCGEAHQLIKAIQQQVNDLCFVFRHFPQPQIHPCAQRAAEAAQAAAAQGQFWQMHDILFTHQQELRNDYLVEYANNLGLDIPQFLQDISSQVHIARINQDIESGLHSGVTAAPALFINGIQYTSRWNIEQLMAAIVTASH